MMSTPARLVLLATLTAAGATVVATPGAAHAQEIDMGAGTSPPPAAAPTDDAYHKGTLGLALPITLLSNVAGSLTGTVERVPTVDVVYFLSDKAAVDLIVGLNFHRKQGVNAAGMTVDTNLFGFAAGAGYRMYTTKASLRSYLEPAAVLSWPDTATSSTFSLSASVAFGVERPVTPWFAVTGQIAGGVAFANSFKDIQLATSAGLAANLYWR